MTGSSAGLVDIIREFLAAHRLMRRLFDRYRRGELRFVELDALIGDHEESVLFRLKERCHALFRTDDDGSRQVRHQEVLFDLAVGSLFHEAMMLREDFYQREAYGPRMRELRSQAGDEAAALIREFERILSASRVDELVQEVEALFERTGEQLIRLLGAHRQEGLAARCLIENRMLVEEVFPEEFDALLGRLYGDAVAAYAFAGRSYLTSGYFGEAERAFAEAIARGGQRQELERLCTYARGMRAYRSGDYAESVSRLGQWLGDGAPADGELTELAQAAVSSIGKLARGEGSERVAADAEALLARIGPGGVGAAQRSSAAERPTALDR